MGNVFKSFLFWTIRFFDCLFSKRYWKQVVFKEVKSFLKQILSICFWVRLTMGVFFIVVTICTIIVCIIPGIILFSLDKLNLKHYLLRFNNQC
jgi:hypothetical protein